VAWAIDPILFPVTFILWLLLVSVGVVIAVYDVLHQIIVEEALILFLGLCIAIGMHGLGFLIVPLPFLILWIISRGAWIGFGDVELMACIGMLLGISGGINAVVIAFWSACIVVLPWYLVNKWSKRKVSHKVPFGPFLLMGTYLVGICGIRVITLMMHVLQ
jgi:leader peptidase (prepilin peptidase)/N-methyltransferase